MDGLDFYCLSAEPLPGMATDWRRVTSISYILGVSRQHTRAKKIGTFVFLSVMSVFLKRPLQPSLLPRFTCLGGSSNHVACRSLSLSCGNACLLLLHGISLAPRISRFEIRQIPTRRKGRKIYMRWSAYNASLKSLIGPILSTPRCTFPSFPINLP